MPKIELIKSSIADAYRFARNNDTRVSKSVGTYLQEGKDIPIATLMHKIDGIKKARMDLNELLFGGRIESKSDYKQLWAQTMNNVSNAEAYDENFDALILFDEALQKLYPKNAKKKMKVIERLAKKAVSEADDIFIKRYEQKR